MLSGGDKSTDANHLLFIIIRTAVTIQINSHQPTLSFCQPAAGQLGHVILPSSVRLQCLKSCKDKYDSTQPNVDEGINDSVWTAPTIPRLSTKRMRPYRCKNYSQSY